MLELWPLYALVITSIIAPIIIGGLQYLGRQLEVRHAEEREDLVANRVTEVARAAAMTSTITNAKLDLIHGLVNSQMSAALQAEHDALVTQIALMEEIIALRRKDTGEVPTQAAISAMKIIKGRVQELANILAERAKKISELH